MSFSLWPRVVACLAAVGVVFGTAQITSGSTNSTKESVFIGIVPARLLDTRAGQTTFDGSDQAVGRLDAGTTYELDIAGRAEVPTDALSVTANLVAVNPSAPGHLTVYPCSVDRPNASALNYMPGVNNANEFSVPLGPDGDICIYTLAETDIIVDVYGYYTGAHQTTSTSTGQDGRDGTDGADGQDGQDGAPGTPGDPGAAGTDGQDAESPARVIWVADDGTGDFTKLSAALGSIGDNDYATPYVIKIAPGVYTEDSKVTMKNYVDVEGSGQSITTINCACSNAINEDAAVISAGAITAEISHLTLNNTGGGDLYSNGVHADSADESFSMSHVSVTATGGTGQNVGVYNNSSSTTMNNVTTTAFGPGNSAVSNYGVFNVSSNSRPTMDNVTAKGTANATNSSYGVYNSSASPTIRNSSLAGGNNSILNVGIEASASVANTMLTANADGPVGSLACVGAYDESFNAFDSDCN